MNKSSLRRGTLYGVSLGPGDPELLTLKALNTLKKVDCIFTVHSMNTNNHFSRSILEYHPDLLPKEIPLSFTMSKDKSIRENQITNNAAIINEYLLEGKHCAVAIIGDSLTYGTYGYLLKEIKELYPDAIYETIPGVNSWSSLGSALNKIMVEDEESLHILPSFMAESHAEQSIQLLQQGQTVVFLKTFKSRNELLDLLTHSNLDLQILYGERIGYPDEFLSEDPTLIYQRPFTYLSLMIVRKKS